MHDIALSPTLIFRVTDSVKKQVIEGQNRPCDNLYPIVYLDYGQCADPKLKKRDELIYDRI